MIGWLAFHQLEPWGTAVEDHRFAQVLDLTFAVNSRANSKPPTWFDWDPGHNIRPDPTPDELDEKVRDFFMGIKTIKKKARKKRKPSARGGFGKTARTPPPAK